MALLDGGDVAVVPEPGYAVYDGGTVLAGGEPYRYALTPRTAFLLELAEIPAEVIRRTRLVYLNYPNNPTAAVATREYLERTVAFCRRHDILIAYDNPYCEITFDGYVAPSIFEIPGAWECAVEFHSRSKRKASSPCRGAGSARAVRGFSGSRSPSRRRGSARRRSVSERCWPLFEPRKVPRAKARLTWAASLVLHGALLTLAVTSAWRIDRPQSLITIIPPQPPRRTELPPFGGTKRGKGPSGGLGRPPAPAPAVDTTTPPPAPTVGKPHSALAASSAAIGPHIVSPPQVGDGRLWVLPRPALPAEVADALYAREEHKD